RVDEELYPTLKKGGEGGFSKDDSFAKEVLKLNICDPAMGSGHFLVEAVQFLADEIAYHPTTELKTPKSVTEDEINYWKRKVVESCIYGVDIKELAVELAKLSLWLKTVDKSQPLNFLDHHLRCGNSLIGARINDLNSLPQLKGKRKKIEEQDKQLILFDISQFKEDITAIIKGFHAIEEMPSEKLSDIKTKETTFKKLTEELERYREIADLNLSFYFGNNFEQKEKDFEKIVPELILQKGLFGADKEISLKQNEKNINITDNIYRAVVRALQSKESKTLMPKLKPLLENSETIAKDKNFFHWELEFTEVFFNEDGSPKENPGFDCVIGNPPYVNVEGIPSDERDFLMQAGIYTTPIKRMDIFIPFHELSIKLLRHNGQHSFIVPFPLLTQDYGQQLRVFFLKNTIIKSIVDLSKYKIFPDAVVRNIIPVFEKKITVPDYSINVITQNEDPNKIQAIRGTVKSIDASQFRDTYENMFRIDLTPELHSIQKKIDSKAIKFGKIFAASWGARGVPVEKFHLDSPINKHCKKMVKGGNVERYGLSYSEKWLLYDVKRLYRPSMPEFFENDKIIFQEVTGHHGLIGVYDDEKYYTDHSLICCVPKYCFEGYDENKLHKHKIYIHKEEIESSKNYNILYVLTVMNSKVNGFYFSKFVGYALNVYPENIEYLPIPPISFTTLEKERKKRVDEAIRLYQTEIKTIALNADKWQNKDEVRENDKGRDKKGSAKFGKVAGKPLGYKLTAESVSVKDSRLGGEVHGVREGTGEYGPPEGTSGEGEDSTRPLDSTRYLETAQGIKTYSEVAEIVAVSVAKKIEAVVDRTPEDIHITPEWICKLHNDIAGSLFPGWAGRFRDINVHVGAHIPPPYFEVPVHMRLYCEDLTARISFVLKEKDIEKISETLAYADWRFQWIHPFRDFNGRVGRILLAAVLFRLKLPPAETALVEPEEKERYLKALHAADAGNLSLLTDLWFKRLSEAFKEQE
ncbi:MAG: Fic family protein, partial [Thermodesulfovibrionia bacterium]|nr:Fic family protein [Thermodesulfovibrionia bacterium]